GPAGAQRRCGRRVPPGDRRRPDAARRIPQPGDGAGACRPREGGGGRRRAERGGGGGDGGRSARGGPDARGGGATAADGAGRGGLGSAVKSREDASDGETPRRWRDHKAPTTARLTELGFVTTASNSCQYLLRMVRTAQLAPSARPQIVVPGIMPMD